MTLVVILTVRREAAEAFAAHEREAARVMARHGGAIERTVVVPGDDPAVFREVHVVTFPDDAALTAYRADPAMAAVAHLRAASVIATEVLVGHDGPSDRRG